MTTLKYCWAGTTELVSLDKYILEDGQIKNKSSCKYLSYRKLHRGDCICNVYIDGKQTKSIIVARAILATLVGPPPTPYHTADHIDRNPENNAIENLRWASKIEQVMNRTMSKTRNNAFVVVKDGVERTANECAKELGCHPESIRNYAQDNKHGFSYKKYPDLPGEIWMKVEGSENFKGRWEVSNMKRAKYITKHASIVYDKFCLINKYPSIQVNGKQELLHTLVFKAFNPDIIIGKGEVIRHLDDDPSNFAPENLAIGTRSKNGEDAHDNGRYDGTKSARRPVVSYIEGTKERDHDSLAGAVKYLKENGHPKAACRGIRIGLNTDKIRYGRTWKTL